MRRQRFLNHAQSNLARILDRGRRELQFVKDFALPNGPDELWRTLIDFKEVHGVFSKRLLRRLFPGFIHPLSRRAIPRDNELTTRFLRYCIANFRQSRSQFLQDTMVLFFLGEKRHGYFVEFGATNGLDRSNSYQLEARWGWQGIVAEPALCWHDALRANRHCNVDLRCVWRVSGEELEFYEAVNATVSTLERLVNQGARRERRSTYVVRTVSLEDLLAHYDAPRDIDFVSVDTEGSEWEILNAFDLSKRSVSIFAIEHNYDPLRRQKVRDLMLSHDYIQVLENLSLYDDWYVKRRFVEQTINN